MGKRFKKRNKVLDYILYLIICFVLISFVCLIYLMFRPKFKSITVELGTTSVSVDDFLVSDLYKKGSSSETSFDELDLTQVGTIELVLLYHNKDEVVTLTIEDTTAPVVKFSDVIKAPNYEINALDFIESIEDYSEYKVEVLNDADTSEYGDYEIIIKVEDIYGNYVENTCNLKISWLNMDVTIELGSTFGYSDILYDIDEYKYLIDESEIEKVDTSSVGEYTIIVVYEDEEYTSYIHVVDTTPPSLTLKSVTIYDDETNLDYTSFIKKVSDASGEVTTTLLTDIPYGEVGKYDIVIEAVDASGNSTEETTTLTVKKDTDGPVFSGLSDISISKGSTYNYISGVTAKDAHDGVVDFTVDSSSVNNTIAGTYYVTYKATDKSGNTTTKKRKVTVEHDSSDTDALFDEFYNNYLSGKSIVEMATEIRTRIKATTNWGGDDPVWYGLTNGAGNCYVHALILQRALTKAGYSNIIIWRSDKGHYWNLVYTNGAWYHIDSTLYNNTPVALRKDEEQEEVPVMKGLGWDKSLWPNIWSE